MAPTTRSSVRNVFATAELVEQILLQLPLVDQFVVTRVNKLCRDTIKKVGSLQKDMQMTHSTADIRSLRPEFAKQLPTRFFLGDSSALFDIKPLFLAGLGSLFYGTTPRGLYKGSAERWNGQCWLHFDTAPFYICKIEEAKNVDFPLINVVFRWHPPETWLYKSQMRIVVNPEKSGQILLSGSQGSWAKMKISPVPLPVMTTVIVTTNHGYFLFSPKRKVPPAKRFIQHTEPFHHMLQPEDATVGNMMSFLTLLRAEASRMKQMWNDDRFT